MSLAIGPDDVLRAAEALQEAVIATPCVPSRLLSEATGANVRLKLENLQSTGSFKVRGALYKLLSLNAAERRRGVVAMSAGNHAQAVAYHAQRLGIPALIVMPRFTPSVKQEQTRRYGAEVILQGDSVSEAGALARRLGQERNRVLVHPYDDPLLIAGQGSVGVELLREAPDLDLILVPVGGGGLISGIATIAKFIEPDIRIIGVQAARFPAMQCALTGREPEFGPFTIAEGIAIKSPGTLTRPIVRALVDEILLVEETDIEKAVLLLLELEKTVAEGAGAAGLAALLAQPEHFAGQQVGIVVSGGNIDMPILSSIIQRGLVRSGRLVRLTVEIRDVPGELAKSAGCISEHGANIVQVGHQRIFTELPVQSTELQFVLQTRGPEHIEEVVAALRERGYRVSVQRAAHVS
jgi:threonine dehydratase